ncbi:MAG TPA: O-antigen ligase family protein [Dissulfurispiraceae bacterium]|nr:O-antigen ligase family protein [Dissulfurispiraceae bacterium]
MAVFPSTSFRLGSLSADRLLYWSFCALFFFLPIWTSPVVIAAILCLAIWIFSGKAWKDRDCWIKAPWLAPVLLFMVLPWIALLWSPDLKEGLRFATKSHHWLLTFAIASLKVPDDDFDSLLKAFLAGLAIVAIISVLQSIGVVPVRDGIPTVLDAKHITGSVFLVFGIALLLFYFVNTQGFKQKSAIVALTGLFLIALGASGGRIGYVALIIVGPFLAFLLMERAGIIKVAIVGLLLAGVLFSFTTVRDRFTLMQSEIQRYEHSDPNSSVGIRLHMWKGAFRIFLQHPVIGAGTGSYKQEMKQFETPELTWRDLDNPHNNYLYMAASFGIIGIFALLWLLYAFFKKGWTARAKATGFAVFSYGVIICIASLTYTPILALASSHLFALLMGIRTMTHEA